MKKDSKYEKRKFLPGGDFLCLTHNKLSNLVFEKRKACACTSKAI